MTDGLVSTSETACSNRSTFILTLPPTREAWTAERLDYELAITFGYTLEPSSLSYSSALNSYVSFCTEHSFSINPTPKTLCYFIVYTTHYIKPSSVKSYLSGICNQLEPFFPEVRSSFKSSLVRRALSGSVKRHEIVATRKHAISFDELKHVHSNLCRSTDLDSQLFLAICHTSFHALLHLGESVWPDRAVLQDYRNVVMRPTATMSPKQFTMLLPTHKDDRLFEGSRVLIDFSISGRECEVALNTYLQSRDKRFPLKPELWLRADGSIPTRSWFLELLAAHFHEGSARQSFRPGGATYLATMGVPADLIQATGRWKSDDWEAFVRTHPALLAAILFRTQHTLLARP